MSEFGSVTGADAIPEAVNNYPDVKKHPFIDLNKDISCYFGKFDIITALDVIEHIENDGEALSAMWDLLKSPGELILTVPAYGWLWGGEDDISMHKRRYTIKRLRSAIQQTKFTEEFSSYFNFSILAPMAGVIWTKKLIGWRHSDSSNLSKSSWFINELLYKITSLENTWVGNEKLSLPAGPSIVCRLSKNPTENPPSRSADRHAEDSDE